MKRASARAAFLRSTLGSSSQALSSLKYVAYVV